MRWHRGLSGLSSLALQTVPLSNPAPLLMSQSNQANANGGAVRGPLTSANIAHLKWVKKRQMSQPIKEGTDEKLLLGRGYNKAT